MHVTVLENKMEHGSLRMLSPLAQPSIGLLASVGLHVHRQAEPGAGDAVVVGRERGRDGAGHPGAGADRIAAA